MNKKTCIILLAFALVMSLTQCKKNNETNTTNEGEKVFITLNVNKGNNSRLDVDPPHVNFENGDVIHVASNGVYVGSLEYNGTNFEGEISNATEGQPLYFYLLGNVTPTETLTAGTTTTCSVNISDQTGDLPVIACAPSNENVGETSTFTATLRNKCALVKFNVNTPSNSVICIKGMNNKVVVDMGTHGLSYEKVGSGVIRLGPGNGEKWAILLPQEALVAGESGSAYSEDGEYVGTRSAVPTIYENGYLTMGIQVFVAIEVNQGEAPVCAINGKFTINTDGNQVYFSKGNLQYKASTNTWRFAEEQYDCIGSDNTNISSTYNGWIDLFGWGTSGYNHGAICYQPWSSSDENSHYKAYGSNYEYNLNDSTGMADWGYNPISNGGNQENQWRTLTNAEWYYLLNSRMTASGIRYAKAQVFGINGVILLPDDWDESTYNLSSTNTYNANFNSNVVNASQWSTLEQAGAVFLLAAGYRSGTSVVDRVGSQGCYWSATVSRNFYVNYVDFYNSNLQSSNESMRCIGRSVRLVRNAE
jgi:hypothetical protein